MRSLTRVALILLAGEGEALTLLLIPQAGGGLAEGCLFFPSFEIPQAGARSSDAPVSPAAVSSMGSLSSMVCKSLQLQTGLPLLRAALVPLGALGLRGFVPRATVFQVFACRLRQEEAVIVPATWCSPQQILKRWRLGQLALVDPLRVVLEALTRDPSLASAQRALEGLADNPHQAQRSTLFPGIELIALKTPTLPPATHTNAYLLGQGEARVLVDPGCPWEDELEPLFERLDSLSQEGAFVQELWLTHHHFDHWASVKALRARYPLRVRAHPRCAAACPEGIVDASFLDHELLLLSGVQDQRWTLQHAPGHTPGHVVFHEARSGALLAGDQVAGVGTVIVSPPEGDMADYLESLGLLESMNARLLLPGHGPPTARVAARLAFYRRHRLEREASICERLRQGSATLPALVESVYQALDPALTPLAEQNLHAHLLKLQQEGRAMEVKGRWRLSRSAPPSTA